jgi:phosphonate transport system ATP-binding protein
VLAQAFTQRIIGLKAGEVVFDGTPDELTDDVLTSIYGEEDWTAMRRKDGDHHDDTITDEERMAGLA